MNKNLATILLATSIGITGCGKKEEHLELTCTNINKVQKSVQQNILKVYGKLPKSICNIDSSRVTGVLLNFNDTEMILDTALKNYPHTQEDAPYPTNVIY